MLMVSNAIAEVPITPPANFGGGLNIKTNCTDIDDNETCDESNFVSDIYGSAQKRNGSRRFITQATSTNPFTSLYRLYQTSGTTVVKSLIGASNDRLYASTQTPPIWMVISSGNAPNQHYEFVTMRNKVIWTGDGLTDPIRQYDVLAGSASVLCGNDGSSETVVIRAKHIFTTRNYFFAGNIRDVTLPGSTTDYPSRMYFSLLNNPSSMTALRYIDFRANDGEQLNAISEMNGFIHFWKENSIAEMTIPTNLNLSVYGGDQTVTQIVSGFGLYAIRTLANLGDFYIFGARDGLRLWDGGRRSRLQLEQTSRILSIKIKPIIDRSIRAGTWRNAVGRYYPRKQWYVLSLEDPERSPHGKNNSVYIYDVNLGVWHRFLNWNADSFVTLDGTTDLGDLLFGDSTDGYVYNADLETAKNDARRELSIDPMDSTMTATGIPTWIRGAQDNINFVESTGSVKVFLPDAGGTSSTTLMRVINIGQWADASKVTKDDKLSFKLYSSSVPNISSVSVQLEIDDIIGDFDTNFTSVTISSNSLGGGNTTWLTIEVPLSSFTILDSWGLSVSSETFPYGTSLTYYGVRFVVWGVGCSTVSIDDLRLVGQSEQPLNAYRFTKQWSFGVPQNKTFKSVLLNLELAGDSNVNVDIFNNFGDYSRTIILSGGFGKELYVSGFGGSNNITKLSSIDFSVLNTTVATAQTVFAARPMTVDESYIYAGDQYNNQLLRINKSSMTQFTTYGSIGSGTTNFYLIYQIAVDDKYLYVCDFGNNRVKIHKKDTLEFVNSYGTLGKNTTSFHNPTGVAVDQDSIYVAQDGNSSLMKLSKSTGGLSGVANLNLTTIGDTTLAVDELYLYDAYNTVSSTSINHLDVVLEKRFKSNLNLTNKVIIRPDGVVNISTYSLQGDLGISDDCIYISFTDDANGNGFYYIQKRLKSDFSLIKEYKSRSRHFAVAHNGLAYRSKRKTLDQEIGTVGSYLQLKFWDSDDLDNNMKLYNEAFKIIPFEGR